MLGWGVLRDGNKEGVPLKSAVRSSAVIMARGQPGSSVGEQGVKKSTQTQAEGDVVIQVEW